MKRKKLVIISHTEHYKNEGVTVGWGATVNEINYLSDFWEEIVHLGCLYDEPPPPSSQSYANSNIRFVALKPFGGEKIWSKLNIIWTMPSALIKIGRELKNATEVQFRSPTGIGVYLLPAFSFFFKRRFKFWVKYAGSWVKKDVPFGYRLQRWWLKKNLARCKVTVNGFWKDQASHCFSFENPCLTTDDLAKGQKIQSQKRFANSFRLAFVGRLDDAKGVSRIIEALGEIDERLIERIDFIGDGAKRSEYEGKILLPADKFCFHGFLDSGGVHEILSKAHFFLLPSDSEGFPKVIAEAACYGCIPVVSDVGSITHYINETNGFLWKSAEGDKFPLILNKALNAPSRELEEKSRRLLDTAKLFTFENYRAKLEKHILD